MVEKAEEAPVRGSDAGEEVASGLQAALLAGGGVVVVALVLELDRDPAVEPGVLEDLEAAGPAHLAVAGDGVAPEGAAEAVALGGERRLLPAVLVEILGEDLGVLAVDVVDAGAELADEAHRIDAHAHQVRRVEVDPGGRGGQLLEQ